MWSIKNNDETSLYDSLEVFRDLIPSLVLIGDIVHPPIQYCVLDPGVQLVCKYLKHYEARTLDLRLFDGKVFYSPAGG